MKDYTELAAIAHEALEFAETVDGGSYEFRSKKEDDSYADEVAIGAGGAGIGISALKVAQLRKRGVSYKNIGRMVPVGGYRRAKSAYGKASSSVKSTTANLRRRAQLKGGKLADSARAKRDELRKRLRDSKRNSTSDRASRAAGLG